MHLQKYLLLKRLTILCFILIFNLTLSDCPISFYPQGTFAGSIHADIDHTITKIKNLQYPFNLVQPLTSSAPKVAISKCVIIHSVLNSLSYRSDGGISFNIFYKPSPSFLQLLFVVTANEQGKNEWNFLRFSFFASQNKLFELGSQYVSTFANTELQTRKLVTSKLPLENFYQKPVLKVFLNGLTVSSSVIKQQIQQIKSQIDTYRKGMLWSPSIMKILDKKLIERQMIQIQLSSITIDNKTLSFYVDLGFKQSIQFISFSYVIFATNQHAYKNQFIEGKFTFNFDSFINLPSLQNMDLFFVGIESLKFKQFEFLSLSPTLLTNKNQTFSLLNGFSSYQTKNSFTMVYFALSRSRDSYCANCRDGNIIYENFCISECPQSYVKRLNGTVTYCEFCDIKQFKVQNANKNQCICALQYFALQSRDSRDFICSPCNYQCLTCEQENKCLTCDGLYLNTFRVLSPQKSQCLCAQGYYDDGKNNIKCLKCHESCLSCKGPSMLDCETCIKGRIKGIDGNCICDGNFVEKNGKCVCESPNFNYKNYCFTFLAKNNCSENEIQITVNGTKRCECKPNYLRFRSICILCGQNEKVDNQTGRCQCKENFYKDQKSGACVGCGNGKIFSEETNKCVCMKGSFQTSDGRCLKCGRRQTLVGNECKCVYNYFKGDSGECQRCLSDSTRAECQINGKRNQ